MEQELLTRVDRVVDAVVNVAPHVWDAFYRQQYVIAIMILAGLIVSIIVLIKGLHVLATGPKWAMEGDENIAAEIILGVSGVATLVLFAVFLAMSLPRLINPTYYAIKALVPGS